MKILERANNLKNVTPHSLSLSLLVAWHVFVCFGVLDVLGSVPNEDSTFGSNTNYESLIGGNGNLKRNYKIKIGNCLTLVMFPECPRP